MSDEQRDQLKKLSAGMERAQEEYDPDEKGIPCRCEECGNEIGPVPQPVGTDWLALVDPTEETLDGALQTTISPGAAICKQCFNSYQIVFARFPCRECGESGANPAVTAGDGTRLHAELWLCDKHLREFEA